MENAMTNVGIALLALAGLSGLAVLVTDSFCLFFLTLVLAAAGFWCIFPLGAIGSWLAGLPWWVWAGAVAITVVVLAVRSLTEPPPAQDENEDLYGGGAADD